ncbi:MAG TPA: hypothetical protein ENN73_04375, partial [Firmicutes bacterium]|nr:hypothetical protein [Bacillota bacterium]
MAFDKVILFMTDAVRPDYLGCYGSNNHTPNIDSLAENGIKFNNCYTAAPWTVPSFYSLITGKYPSQHGIGWGVKEVESDKTRRLNEFKKLGYETILMTDCYWLSRRFGYGNVFDRNFEFWNYLHNNGNTLKGFVKILNAFIKKIRYKPGRNDKRIINMLKNIVAFEKKQFIIVHLMSAHLPLNPGLLRINIKDVASGKIQLSNDLKREYRNEYARAVRLIDSLIGSFIRYLKDKGLFDRSLIGIFSDHGENLGDHGLIDHQFSLSYYLMK